MWYRHLPRAGVSSTQGSRASSLPQSAAQGSFQHRERRLGEGGNAGKSQAWLLGTGLALPWRLSQMQAAVGCGSVCLTFYVHTPASTKVHQNSQVATILSLWRVKGTDGRQLFWIVPFYVPWCLAAVLYAAFFTYSKPAQPWEVFRQRESVLLASRLVTAKEGAVSLVWHYRKENPYISE